VSVAVQETLVVPIENVLPLTGVQLVVTGDAPLMTDGVPYTTGTAKPVGDTCVTGAGQVIVGGSVVGGCGVGSIGDEHPTRTKSTLAAMAFGKSLAGRNKLLNKDSKNAWTREMPGSRHQQPHAAGVRIRGSSP
jgi:hypothetical protein